MRRGLLPAIIAVAALQIGLCWAAMVQPAAASPKPATSASAVATPTIFKVTGKISAIAKVPKVATIEDSKGGVINLKVDDPDILKELKVGDSVAADYYELAGVRRKRPNENLPSVSVASGILKANAAEGTRSSIAQRRFMFSITRVDEANGVVTVKGADGSVETLKTRYAVQLSGLKPGDELVVMAAVAIATSIKKT